jgi:DNA-binding MarR family transcriptional regulator
VTGIVRRLKAAQLIEELPKSDRRFTTVKLTAQGKQVHQRARSALNHSITARFAEVSEGEHERLQELLRHMHIWLRRYLDSGQDASLAADYTER